MVIYDRIVHELLQFIIELPSLIVKWRFRLNGYICLNLLRTVHVYICVCSHIMSLIVWTQYIVNKRQYSTLIESGGFLSTYKIWHDANVREQCCIFYYYSWTDTTKPILVFFIMLCVPSVKGRLSSSQCGYLVWSLEALLIILHLFKIQEFCLSPD